jgi:hypothetical protein
MTSTYNLSSLDYQLNKSRPLGMRPFKTPDAGKPRNAHETTDKPANYFSADSLRLGIRRLFWSGLGGADTRGKRDPELLQCWAEPREGAGCGDAGAAV